MSGSFLLTSLAMRLRVSPLSANRFIQPGKTNVSCAENGSSCKVWLTWRKPATHSRSHLFPAPHPVTEGAAVYARRGEIRRLVRRQVLERPPPAGRKAQLACDATLETRDVVTVPAREQIVEGPATTRTDLGIIAQESAFIFDQTSAACAPFRERSRRIPPETRQQVVQETIRRVTPVSGASANACTAAP